LTADNLNGERCATAQVSNLPSVAMPSPTQAAYLPPPTQVALPPVTMLPATGETPWWRDLVLALIASGALIIVAGVGVLLKRKAR
jgi:hypothetical protein